jgi:hypothetical protein
MVLHCHHSSCRDRLLGVNNVTTTELVGEVRYARQNISKEETTSRKLH